MSKLYDITKRQFLEDIMIFQGPHQDIHKSRVELLREWSAPQIVRGCSALQVYKDGQPLRFYEEVQGGSGLLVARKLLLFTTSTWRTTEAGELATTLQMLFVGIFALKIAKYMFYSSI